MSRTKDEIVAEIERELAVCERNAATGLVRAIGEMDNPERADDAARLKASEFFFARAANSEARAVLMRLQIAKLNGL